MTRCVYFLFFAGLLLTAMVSGGCVVHTNGEPIATIYVDTEPPAPRHEVMPPTPGPQYVWVPGNWQWNGRNWVWQPGHWQRVSHGYTTWVPGHWAKRGHRWVWIEGHWR